MNENTPMTQEVAEQLVREEFGTRLKLFKERWTVETLHLISVYLWQPPQTRPARGIGLGAPAPKTVLPEKKVLSQERCKELVRHAKKGSKLHLDVARKLAADLLERGEPLPEPLLELAVSILRGKGPRPGKGRPGADRVYRDAILQQAWNYLLTAGCDKHIALDVLHKVAKECEIKIYRDTLKKLCRKNPGKNRTF